MLIMGSYRLETCSDKLILVSKKSLEQYRPHVQSSERGQEWNRHQSLDG